MFRTPVYLLILIVVSQIGCGTSETKTIQNLPEEKSQSVAKKKSPSNSKAKTTHQAERDSAEAGETEFEIKFKDGGGETAFYLASRGTDAKLLSPEKTEIAKFKVTDTTIKIVDKEDAVLGYVRCSTGRYKVQDEDKNEVFELQRSTDGDWKLKDAGEKMLVRVKKRDYGFEGEEPSDKSLFKVKLKSGKTSVRDASDKTMLSTKDKIETFACVPLGFEIKDLTLKAALSFAIHVQLGQ